MSIRYVFVLSFAIFCYFCYYCRLSSALFRWEAASAGSGQSNARWSKRFWRSPRRVRCDLGSLVSAFIFYSILECGRVWRMFCTPRRRAATGRLSCPRAGCRSGDAACLDLDLRLRDAAVRRDQFTACLATYRWWWCEVVRSGSARAFLLGTLAC